VSPPPFIAPVERSRGWLIERRLTTPGVIRRVSELFRGHTNLIMKFNRFLPPGYRIDESTIAAAEAEEAASMAGSQPMAHAGVPPPTSHVSLPPPPARRPVTNVRQDGKPPEFDHAIQYVTKIKQRFVKDQPDVYRRFLEILHSYQKNSASAADQGAVISEVLSRVAELFQDHPDLLQDFRFFLPDTVQDMARERLQRIAAQHAHARAYGMHDAMEAERAAQMAAGTQYASSSMYQDMTASHVDERAYQHHLSRTSLGMGPGRSERGMEGEYAARAAMTSIRPQLAPTERTFFQRVKAALGGREGWVEFLKTLDLFSKNVLSRAELLQLLAELLPPQLLDELKSLIITKGAMELTPSDAHITLPISDQDFTGCAHCTPSYRELPEGYPQLACSERSMWEQRVLNDRWVSIQTGSEDYSFKHMRRNQYEEALFRCEDERYEVDMVIDTNASTIKILEPLAQEINTLRAVKGYHWQFRLDRRALGVIHLKAIARVYGTRGEEMLELLRKNPGGAVPVILKRLKEKDLEWRRARTERNRTWRDVMANNFHRSLDHRSFYFRQQDKRAIAAKTLIQEMRTLVESAQNEIKAWTLARENGGPSVDDAEGKQAG
jgi:paired amphipathic helix protein Sin3a